MTARETLHRLVDALPDVDVAIAARVLEALARTAGPPDASDSVGVAEAREETEPDANRFAGTTYGRVLAERAGTRRYAWVHVSRTVWGDVGSGAGVVTPPDPAP